MKKRKFSIILNISALCLCLAAVAIGVYSVKTAQLNITGTIGFQAHNCDVMVNGIIENGSRYDSTTKQLTPTTLYYNTTGAAESTPTYKNVHDDTTGWAIGDLYFDDLNDVPVDKIAKDIVITIKMYNKAKYPVYAAFDASTLGIDTSQIKATAKKGTETAKDVLCVEMAANQTEADVTTLTITFTLKSEEFTKLTLTSTNPLLKFTKDKPMPTKGQLITMDLGGTHTKGLQNTYRVLKTEGNTALVVAMFDVTGELYYWKTNATTTDANRKTVTKYDGSDLDTYLNTTWYGTLNDAAKSAIVESNITQYSYGYSWDKYNTENHASLADYTSKAAVGSAMTRKVYALDVEDIEEYFGGTAGTNGKTTGNYNNSDLQTLFWERTGNSDYEDYPWLRSAAVTTEANYAFQVYWDDSMTYVSESKTDECNYLMGGTPRPAFRIKLSSIDWSSYQG